MRERFDMSDRIGVMRRGPERHGEVFLVEARTIRQRALGLMGRELQRLPRDAGVLFSRCSCIHTFGMRGPISLTWIREEVGWPGRTIEEVSIDASVPPNRIVWGPRGATGVIEAHECPVDIELKRPPSLEIWGRNEESEGEICM